MNATAAVAQLPKRPLVSQDVTFDGGAGSFLVVGILAFLVTAFSFGICYPWALVMKEKWAVEHTVIDGKRLQFVGSAWGLFGLWIKMWFFTVITLGIYSFWIVPALHEWKAKNTRVVR